LGERTAYDLGLNLPRLQRRLLVLIATLTAIAVSLTGVIGFIGLIVPHLLRLLVGADHRRLVLPTALGGAILLVLADLLARTLASPAEIPVGIFTSPGPSPPMAARWSWSVMICFSPPCLWILSATEPRGRFAASEPASLQVREGNLRYGALRPETYAEIPGVLVRDLTNHHKFPDHPDSVETIGRFEVPSDRADHYGMRLTGYPIPPVTGDYVCYLASDEESRLYLSPNEDGRQMRAVAREAGVGPGNGASRSRPDLMNWTRYRVLCHSRRVGGITS
jgi:hypothetical protein